MKLMRILLAVAMKLIQFLLVATMTIGASSAFAASVTPTDIQTARGASQLDQTWVSGSSAMVGNVYIGFNKLCDTGTLSLYTADASAGAGSPVYAMGSYLAYACKVGSRTKVLYHTMDGGSLSVFTPHVNGTKLDRLKEISSNTACTFSGTTTTPNGSTASVYNKCSRAGIGYSTSNYSVTGYSDSNAPTIPAGGFSDVESRLWGGLFLHDPSNYGTESPANLTQGFGIIVNTSLYRNLQVAQGIYTSVSAAASADSAFSPVNAPNITSPQYTSIVAGTYYNDWSPILGSAGVNQPIYLVRGTDATGFQAASNIIFLKNPCSGDPAIGGFFPPVVATTPSGETAALAFTDPSNTTTYTYNPTSGLYVFSASSATDVKRAITNAELGGKFAIGVVPLFDEPYAMQGLNPANYHLIKLDWVHPETGDAANARQQLLSGNYSFQFESTYYVANSADSVSNQLIQDVVNNMATAASSCSINIPARGFVYPAGTSGTGSCANSYVAKGTRSGNNCSPLELFY